MFTSFAFFVAATPNHYTALVHVTTAADRTGISENLDLWNNNQGMATHSVNDVWEWLILLGTVFFALGAVPPVINALEGPDMLAEAQSLTVSLLMLPAVLGCLTLWFGAGRARVSAQD